VPTVLKWAGIFAGVRLLFGMLTLLASMQSGEGAMLVLLDLPTLGIYWLLQLMFGPTAIVDAFDVRFWVTGLIVWSLMGAMLGMVVRSRTRVSRAHQ
jgi:hypothetical protein